MKSYSNQLFKTIISISTILILICISGCLEDSTSAENSAPPNSAYLTADPKNNSTTVTLINESGSIAAGKVFHTSFTVTSTASINVNIQVTNGDGVTVYLFSDYNELLNLMNNKNFVYNTALSANYRVTSFNQSATLTAGTWYIAIVNPNLLFSQTVSRIITAYK